MECARPNRIRRRRIIQRLGKALFDLARRLVGKGNRQHSPRRAYALGKAFQVLAELLSAARLRRTAGVGKIVRHLLRLGYRFAGKPVAQNMYDALHEHGRLTAPRPCEDQQRTFHRADRLTLHVIQFAVIGIKKRFFLRIICRRLEYQFHRPGHATVLSKLKYIYYTIVCLI